MGFYCDFSKNDLFGHIYENDQRLSQEPKIPESSLKAFWNAKCLLFKIKYYIIFEKSFPSKCYSKDSYSNCFQKSFHFCVTMVPCQSGPDFFKM
jgi:hypothetical protein